MQHITCQGASSRSRRLQPLTRIVLCLDMAFGPLDRLHTPSEHTSILVCSLLNCRYSKQWEVTVKRLGRWIDFENDYKTLDPSFMESVW